METKNKEWRVVAAVVVASIIVVMGLSFLLGEMLLAQRLQAFHEAVRNGDFRAVRASLVTNRSLAREEVAGIPMAELAMEAHQPEVLKEILDALPRCAPGREGLPMLFIAAWKGTPEEIAEVVRWCPASPVTWRGETVVKWAIRSGRDENVQFLIKTLFGGRSVMLRHPERFLLQH